MFNEALQDIIKNDYAGLYSRGTLSSGLKSGWGLYKKI